MRAQSVLVNTVSATVGRVVNSALGFIVTGLITRSLGAGGFGSYALLISYASILQIVTDAGLYLTLSRVMAESPHRESEYIRHTVWLRLILWIGVFSLGAVGLLFIAPDRVSGISFLILAVGFLFQSLSQLLMSLYQKYGVVWRVSFGDLFGRVMSITAILLLRLDQLTVSDAVLTFTMGTAVALILHYAWAPVRRFLRGSVRWVTCREILKLSWPLGLMLICNAIYFRIDTVLLSLFQSSTEVGLYSLAYRIIESSLFFPAMFGGLLLPRITSALTQNDTARAREWLETGVTFMALCAVPVVIVLSVFSKNIVVLFGLDFALSSSLLRILTIALFSMFIGNMFGFTLVALGKARQLLWLYAGLVVLNISLNIFLIPIYGATAAAWTTVITELASLSMAAYLVYRALSWRLTAIPLLRIIVSSGATLGVLWLIPSDQSVILRLLAGAGMYSGMMVWLKLLNSTRLHLLLQAS